MAREYRYALFEKPEARNDGTKGVDHNIAAVYREIDSGDAWVDVPEHHIYGLQLHGDEMIAALETGTPGQKARAYKDLIRAALDSGGFLPVFDKGWEEVKLEEFMANNDLSVVAAETIDTFIRVTLNQDYAVYFEL